jgi:hypothetical protein
MAESMKMTDFLDVEPCILVEVYRRFRGACPSIIKAIIDSSPLWTDLGANSGHRGEKPATNRLSYGKACLLHKMKWVLYAAATCLRGLCYCHVNKAPTQNEVVHSLCSSTLVTRLVLLPREKGSHLFRVRSGWLPVAHK